MVVRSEKCQQRQQEEEEQRKNSRSNINNFQEHQLKLAAKEASSYDIISAVPQGNDTRIVGQGDAVACVDN